MPSLRHPGERRWISGPSGKGGRTRGLVLRQPQAFESLSRGLDLFDEVIAYRNRVLGHGAPLDAEHYRRFADFFGLAFDEILRESALLTVLRLVSFRSLQVRDGSRVEGEVLEHMGLVPMKREKPHVVPYGAPAPRQDALYLLSEEGALVCLDPLLVAHKEDVFILNEAGGAPEYLSYATGERLRPPDLDGAQGELFERILGYRVDAGRLSRLGDDLAPGMEEASAEASGGDARRLGDFRILRELGHGAMGAVFEAVQESLGRRVALKVLPGTFALDPRRLERFRRERVMFRSRGTEAPPAGRPCGHWRRSSFRSTLRSFPARTASRSRD